MPDQDQNVPWRNLALPASLCLPLGGPPGCGAGGMHDLCWGWPRAAVFACRRAAHLRLLVTGLDRREFRLLNRKETVFFQ